MLIGKNKLKMTKKALCLVFAFLFSIESFGAVISDNDGAAFVTKAEFDALKEDFSNQIRNYNESIDNKVDGAIAAYLAGLKISKKETVSFDAKTNYSFPLVMQSSSNNWNDPTSDYYNVARNRVRYINVTNVNFSYTSSYAESDPSNNVVTWNSETDDSILTIPAGNHRGQLHMGALQDSSTEINPKSGELYYVENTGLTRSLGGTNYKVFDIKANGTGYQYLDYDKKMYVTKQNMAGHFTNSETFWWVYSGVVGIDTSNMYRWDSGDISLYDWTNNYIYAAGRGAGNNLTKYNNIVPSKFGEKVKIKNIPESNSGGSGGFEYTGIGVDSSMFVWSTPGKKSIVYAGNSFIPAQQKEKFAYRPYAPNLNTEVEKVGIRTFGFYRAFAFLPPAASGTTTSKTSGTYQVRSMTYCPPLKAIEYNGYASTIPSFGALPASCVRYYDENGDEHYLDEGMYLRTFDKECMVDFSLTFGTKSGTKNLKIYISKEPFNRVNAKTKLAKFKVDNESSEVTTKTLQTGKRYTIHVDNVQKKDKLYLLWEPETSGEYIALNSFENFVVTSE